MYANVGSFPLGAIVNNAAMNTNVHIMCSSLDFNSLGYMLGVGIAGTYGNFMFNFLRNFYTIFHSSYNTLHFHSNAERSEFLHKEINIFKNENMN
jgi:hypothetical protein